MPETTSHCLASNLFKAGVFVLKKDRQYNLGRGANMDIVLPSNQVSRHHAQIVWSQGEECWMVEDQGSRNGTRVAQVLIKGSTPLRDRDSVVIGPFELRYRRYQGDLAGLLSEVSIEDGETMEAPVFGPDAGISGKFAGTDLVELCQFISFNQKSGLIQIQGPTEMQKGLVLFVSGQIGHAEDRDGDGIGAAHRLLSLPHGTFEFRSPAPPHVARKAASPPIPTERVLMEICRRRDEQEETWDV